jgi:two-component system response regulator GlrR
MQRLMLYDWPGNVRELEHVIEYAVAMTQTDVITEDLILLRTKSSAEEPWRPLKQAKGAFEKNYLIRLLELSGGNVSQAARLAGKYRADFYDLMRKHGLNVDDFKKSK